MNLNRSEASALGRLFSAAVVRDFAQYGQSPLFARLVDNTRLNSTLPPNATVGNTLDEAFNLLNKSPFRNDYVYRSAIAEKILLGRHSLNTATLINEVRTGPSRADVVILNGTSTAYEIKSERDSLSRLATQIQSFRQVFAGVNLVVSDRHVSGAIRLTPEDVGVITLSGRYTLQTIREARHDPGRINPAKALELLRIEEATTILSNLGGEQLNYPNTRIRSELRKIFATLDPNSFHQEMVRTLKNTRSQASQASFLEPLPRSLRTASLVANPTPKKWALIAEAVKTPLVKALSWR